MTTTTETPPAAATEAPVQPMPREGARLLQRVTLGLVARHELQIRLLAEEPPDLGVDLTAADLVQVPGTTPYTIPPDEWSIDKTGMAKARILVSAKGGAGPLRGWVLVAQADGEVGVICARGLEEPTVLRTTARPPEVLITTRLRLGD